MNSTALNARSMGQPVNRVDGRLKVTGTAKYAAEFAPPRLARAVIVSSTISHGSIKSIDSSAAEKQPGVLAVITHLNAPKLPEPPKEKREDGIRIEERLPFADAQIHYGAQHVAVVVADTLEHAREAARAVRIEYETKPHTLTKEDAPQTAKKPEKDMGEEIQVKKGETATVLADKRFVAIEQTYTTRTETHNPMEPSATIAMWEGTDKLTLYDATQYVKGTQSLMARTFGLKEENVHVICPFVGGAFGCKGPVWPHTIIAAMAAKVAGRPVKLELTRQQMFSGTGHRPPTTQKIALAASKNGKLEAIRQEAENLTSPVGQWIELCGLGGANVLYDAPNIEFSHTIYSVNVAQPSFMRAPGECPGTFAMECAMDELAVALKMDPLQLRMVNDSPMHPIKGVRWSTKHLRECYELGAEKFGWAQRKPEPRSMKDGDHLIGWGVATATYPARKWAAQVRIELKTDGTAVVRCAAHDLGTGAYTVLTQISADAIGLPVEKVTFDLGSSDLPFGPVAGGSNTTATVGSAVTTTARKLHEELANLATRDRQSRLHGLNAADIGVVSPGRIGVMADTARSEEINELLRRTKKDSVVIEGGIPESTDEKLGFQSFGVHFCEVKIDPDLPLVRVTRVVSVMDCGRVINPKTGGSQILGGVVMGIGMALQEETHYDRATGLPVTRNLADYHVPVNADVRDLQVHFVGEPDYEFNPMGARGMGEIGITGISAAIANAVYHATGKRVRDLPITIDKLLV